jgi:signal transduction histidine kinase
LDLNLIFNKIKRIPRKIISKFRNAFKRTKYRLTALYSSMVLLFLILFVVVVYSALSSFIYNEQRQQIINLASKEWTQYHQQINNSLDKNFKGNKNIISSNHDIFFYYVLDAKHKYAYGSEQIRSLRPDILRKLHSYKPRIGKIYYEKVSLTGDKIVNLQMTGRLIYDKGKVKGVLFIGQEISFYVHMLHRLLIVLIGLAAAFLIIAFIAAQYTARRSVMPIVRMYNKQRQFIGDASHELRTPLSVIYSTIEVLELEEKDTMSEFGYELLLDMKNEVKSMTNLVKDLLTLAQSDVGAAVINYEKFDLSNEIKQVLRLFRPMADSKNITISMDVPVSLVTYKDREKIRQLVYILLDNAVKYTKEGGKVQINLFKEDSNEKICIQIQDTGIGIKQEQLKRIFDRFYRGDKSRTKEFGGSGLGLAIAKTIVNAHKGSIEVSSVHGEGTTFTVYLPV